MFKFISLVLLFQIVFEIKMSEAWFDYDQFSKSVQDYNNGMQEYAKGMVQLAEGLNKLNKELPKQNIKFSNSMVQLAEGMRHLSEVLPASMKQLTTNLQKLNELKLGDYVFTEIKTPVITYTFPVDSNLITIIKRGN